MLLSFLDVSCLEVGQQVIVIESLLYALSRHSLLVSEVEHALEAKLVSVEDAGGLHRGGGLSSRRHTYQLWHRHRLLGLLLVCGHDVGDGSGGSRDLHYFLRRLDRCACARFYRRRRGRTWSGYPWLTRLAASLLALGRSLARSRLLDLDIDFQVELSFLSSRFDLSDVVRRCVAPDGALDVFQICLRLQLLHLEQRLVAGLASI